MAKKTDQEKDDVHRQIIPRCDDDAMLVWLLDLFHLSPRDTEPGKPKKEPDSFPDRIMLRAVFNASKDNQGFGPSIKTKEWKPMSSAAPSQEQLIQIANEFVAAAQKDCNVYRRREQAYGLFATSGLKGAHPYEQYPFTLTPTGRTYNEKGVMISPASDDDDTHRDRWLQTALAHTRWNQEHFAEATSGVLKLQQEIIREQRQTIAQMESDRRAYIVAAEEALSKKQDREIAARWADAKVTMLGDIWGSIKGYLPPLVAHITKGKGGIIEGIRVFLDGLSEEQSKALLGDKDTPGVLQHAQAELLLRIADGDEPPAKMRDFIVSLNPEQLRQAQAVLRPDQLQMLQMLVKAAMETLQQQNGASS